MYEDGMAMQGSRTHQDGAVVTPVYIPPAHDEPRWIASA